MNVQTYLYYQGNCREAIEFYEKVFDASVEFVLTYAEGPSEAPQGWADRIFHATVKFGDSRVNMADMLADGQTKFDGFALLAHVESSADAARVFAALEREGVVRMPLQSTMWASEYGIVTDRFGITWKIQAQFPPQNRLELA